MLQIQNLTFSYPKNPRKVIDNLSLDISSDGIYGLLGPNGSGKSTLLYLISGLLTPKNGQVLLNGIDTRKRLPQTLSDIFLVPEEFDLPKIKLSQYAKLQSQFYPRFSEEDLRSSLSLFGFEGDFNLRALSMGQKKKVYMCIALASNTPLLLMDEPTNGLDIPSKASFRSFIASHMTEGRTVIISTHQVRDISQLLENVIIIDHSQIALSRSIADVMNRLAFTTTTDPKIIAQAFCSQPDIMGTRVVLPAKPGQETEVDLELLYMLVTTRPNVISHLFNNPPVYEASI